MKHIIRASVISSAWINWVSASGFGDAIKDQINVFGGNDTTVMDIIQKATNLLLFTIGAVSVIVIIYSGYKYVISGGDSGKVGEAKNAIKYAVIGIIVALLSGTIINFVLSQF